MPLLLAVVERKKLVKFWGYKDSIFRERLRGGGRFLKKKPDFLGAFLVGRQLKGPGFRLRSWVSKGMDESRELETGESLAWWVT